MLHIYDILFRKTNISPQKDHFSQTILVGFYACIINVNIFTFFQRYPDENTFRGNIKSYEINFFLLLQFLKKYFYYQFLRSNIINHIHSIQYLLQRKKGIINCYVNLYDLVQPSYKCPFFKVKLDNNYSVWFLVKQQQDQ